MSETKREGVVTEQPGRAAAAAVSADARSLSPRERQRRERLAAELRTNLVKRKQQARAKRDRPEET